MTRTGPVEPGTGEARTISEIVLTLTGRLEDVNAAMVAFRMAVNDLVHACRQCNLDCVERSEREAPEDAGDPDAMQWYPATWEHVRPGDTVRPPGATHVGAGVRVSSVVPQCWHVEPGTGTSQYNPPRPMRYTVAHVLFEGDTGRPRDMNPEAPVEIWLSPAEVAAVEVLGGWAARVRVEYSEMPTHGDVK